MRETPMDRREFIRRCTRAGLSVTAASTLAFLFYDRKAPAMDMGGSPAIRLPDYCLATMKTGFALPGQRTGPLPCGKPLPPWAACRPLSNPVNGCC